MFQEQGPAELYMDFDGLSGLINDKGTETNAEDNKFFAVESIEVNNQTKMIKLICSMYTPIIH